MNANTDLRLCVGIERGGHEKWRMILVDGSIEFGSRAVLDEFIQRERLQVVSTVELRKMAAKFAATVNFEALVCPAVGYDSSEVTACRQIARRQERFHDSGSGWTWWCRFSGCNQSCVCLDALLMLHRIADEYAGEREEGLPVDWLELLREVIAETSSANIGVIRAAMQRRLEGGRGEE